MDKMFFILICVYNVTSYKVNLYIHRCMYTSLNKLTGTFFSCFQIEFVSPNDFKNKNIWDFLLIIRIINAHLEKIQNKYKSLK